MTSASAPVRLAALVPYALDRAPGQRYRIEQWAKHLRGEGVHVRFLPFFSEASTDVLHEPGRIWRKAMGVAMGFARRLACIEQVRQADAVLVYREAIPLGPPLLEDYLSRRLGIVFDFDDAMFVRDRSQATPWAASLRPRDKTARLCVLASHVTVGTEALASFVRERGAAVTVIPSTIDLDTYTLRDRPPNSRPIVAWTGSPTTARYLAGLHPVLRHLATLVDFELLVIGARVDLPGVRMRLIPWRAASEADDLRCADLGIMPLTSDPWSQGKGGMKLLQYMALAIPAVASPVGANSEIVEHGVNGWLAGSAADWIAALTTLLRDPDSRARLGRAARATVERRYAATVQAPRLARVIRDVASRHGARGRDEPR